MKKLKVIRWIAVVLAAVCILGGAYLIHPAVAMIIAGGFMMMLVIATYQIEKEVMKK